MKKKELPKADVGVLVGRFQVHELHEAHIDLIQSVCNEHDKVIIFLGLSPLKTTKHNPLDFESRKQMILDKFPSVSVLYIKDINDDKVWSSKLDEQISDIMGPNQSAVLYGSRDCFINHYTGKFKTQELVQEVYVSGSEVRNEIGRKVKSSPEFRAGVIWATCNQYPSTYPTVDIAVLSEDQDRVLLARKPHESKYRFIGGFSDPNGDSYEADARREVMEEASIDITDPKYIGSFKIDDWRYRSPETNKIKTLFFVCKLLSGRPDAKDDICEVKWHSLEDLKQSHLEEIVDEHKPLMAALLSHPNLISLLDNPDNKR